MSKLINSQKAGIIAGAQTHATDTGSSEVQIAVLTVEIRNLTEHLKTNKKDHSSRRGLLRKVGTRKTLLNNILKKDRVTYVRVCKQNQIKLNSTIRATEVEDTAKA
jgi:small subunit ribosomal protein S15